MAGLGAGIGMFFHRRRALTSFQTVTVDGYAEGIADVVLMSIAVYETAVFPLTPGGVSDEDKRPVAPSPTGSPPMTACPGQFRCRRPVLWRPSMRAWTPNALGSP